MNPFHPSLFSGVRLSLAAIVILATPAFAQTSVVVKNTAPEAVPVREVHQPVSIQATASFKNFSYAALITSPILPGGSGEIYRVPPGKMLVIESYTAEVVVPNGQQALPVLYTVAGGSQARNTLPLGARLNLQLIAGDILTAGANLKIYADSNTSVQLGIERNTNMLESSGGYFSLNGYLVDAR